MEAASQTKNDFSKGSIVKNIMGLAVSMTLAQLINVLYNIVDRIYIGRIPDEAMVSLTGIGLCIPIVSLVMAFANLFGMGGAPLCSIERGRGDLDEAEYIMGNSFSLLVIFGIILTAAGLLVKRPMLYLFGASDVTFPYADRYVTIYLLGSVCVMVGLGMNSFINSQGFGRTGMMTVLLGAVTNIILDPIFIFKFHMGIQGAALATVISQTFSAIWILRFLTGDKAILKLKRNRLQLKRKRVMSIVGLGLSGFTMSFTNSLTQIVGNASLQKFGGDLYVGIMTVVNSVREVFTMPVSGVTNGAQPVIGYNYGAEEYKRVKQSVIIMSSIVIVYTIVMWAFINVFPEIFIRIFDKEGEMVGEGVAAMRIYYFGFFLMALQFAGQAVFVALGKSKWAVFFSIFRKVIIVVPLTLILPYMFGLGTHGVFLAEPISNLIGGIACYGTMLYTVWPELSKKEKEIRGAEL
ncbi:MATE family efflux transporter [Lachnospiraceae bacterium 62-35]